MFDMIRNFYATTKSNDESSETKTINDLEHEIEGLKGIEIQNFIDKIYEFIIDIKLNQLQKYLNEFKIYFRNYIKEYKIDVSKSTFLEIEENEKRKQLEENMKDTETVKIFKIIMNDYKTLLDKMSLDQIKHFAQFLGIELDEYAAEMYLKFIKYGNKNGGWREYNYSMIGAEQLKELI